MRGGLHLLLCQEFLRPYRLRGGLHYDPADFGEPLSGVQCISRFSKNLLKFPKTIQNTSDACVACSPGCNSCESNGAGRCDDSCRSGYPCFFEKSDVSKFSNFPKIFPNAPMCTTKPVSAASPARKAAPLATRRGAAMFPSWCCRRLAGAHGAARAAMLSTGAAWLEVAMPDRGMTVSTLKASECPI